MKKNVTITLFGLAISLGSWLAPMLTGTPAPYATDIIKQEVAQTQSQGADSPFGDSKPDPAATKLLAAVTESPKPHPINWGVVAGLFVVTGGVVLSIRSMAAKAAASFSQGVEAYTPAAPSEWQ